MKKLWLAIRYLLPSSLALILTLCPVQRVIAAEVSDSGLPREVMINGVEFVLVPQGWFWYTVTTGELGLQPPNAPMFRHLRVWLDSYYMARYEARARDFVRFLNSGPKAREMMALQERGTTYLAGHEPLPNTSCTVRLDPAGVYQLTDGQRDLPATYLSATMSDAFAQWMGFRLPTEAQWEKAARGPDPQRRIWPWGDAYPDDTYANFSWSQKCEPAQVAAYPKGRSPYGIYNMAGNVEEHVADWYNKEFDAALKDGARNPILAPTGWPFPEEGPKKISKGGRWSLGPGGLLIAERSFHEPDRADTRMGVRFSVDISTVRDHLARGTATIVNSK